MFPPNRRLERLRKRFSVYRIQHKACLMMHQNYSASELCLVKPEIRPKTAVAMNNSTTRASCPVKRKKGKLQNRMALNQSISKNKNLRKMTNDQMPISSTLSNVLSNPSFTHRLTDDLDFIDGLECLLNFGSGVNVLPVLRDIEILDYFERIAK